VRSTSRCWARPAARCPPPRWSPTWSCQGSAGDDAQGCWTPTARSARRGRHGAGRHRAAAGARPSRSLRACHLRTTPAPDARPEARGLRCSDAPRHRVRARSRRRFRQVGTSELSCARGPEGWGRDSPAALDPAEPRAVGVQHLEHHLQPTPGQLHVGLQRGGGQRAAWRRAQHREGGPHRGLRREGPARRVRPDVAVLGPGQQSTQRARRHGRRGRSAGSRPPASPARRACTTKPRSGLSKPMPARRGKQCFDPVGQQVVLGALAAAAGSVLPV